MDNFIAIIKGKEVDVTDDIMELDSSNPTHCIIAMTVAKRGKAARALIKSGKKPFYLVGATEDLPVKFICSSSKNISKTDAQCLMSGKLYVFVSDIL